MKSVVSFILFIQIVLDFPFGTCALELNGKTILVLACLLLSISAFLEKETTTISANSVNFAAGNRIMTNRT